MIQNMLFIAKSIILSQLPCAWSQLSLCWKKLTQNKLILMSVIQINNVNWAPERQVK